MERFTHHPALNSTSIHQIATFIRLASHLKRDILQPQPISQTTDQLPAILPPSVSQFIRNAVGIPLDMVPLFWDAIKDNVWFSPPAQGPASVEDEHLFRTFGWKLGLSEFLCLSLE